MGWACAGGTMDPGAPAGVCWGPGPHHVFGPSVGRAAAITTAGYRGNPADCVAPPAIDGKNPDGAAPRPWKRTLQAAHRIVGEAPE